MIQYSRLTLQQVIDEALQTTAQHRTAQNLDWTTVAFFVNRAVQEALSKTLPYKYWTYVSTINIPTNPFVLPNGSIVGGIPQSKYIDKIRLMVNYNEEEPYWTEARYADAKEFFSVSDWKLRHNWNKATYDNPVFTIWGSFNTIQPIATLYIAPYDNTVFGNLPSVVPQGKGWFPNQSPINAYLDCYLMPPDLMNPNDILPIPYEFEGLIILYTIIRILSKLGVNDKLQDNLKNAISEQKRIFEIFANRLNLNKKVIESFVDTKPREEISEIENKTIESGSVDENNQAISR